MWGEGKRYSILEREEDLVQEVEWSRVCVGWEQGEQSGREEGGSKVAKRWTSDSFKATASYAQVACISRECVREAEREAGTRGHPAIEGYSVSCTRTGREVGQFFSSLRC